jgi:hypothetical protein
VAVVVVRIEHRAADRVGAAHRQVGGVRLERGKASSDQEQRGLAPGIAARDRVRDRRGRAR